MKKLKFDLRWQILLAIFLASAVGFFFPTKYKITFDSYENLAKELSQKGISDKQIETLQLFRDKAPMTQSRFIAQIEIYCPGIFDNLTKEIILANSRYNPLISKFGWAGKLFLRLLQLLLIPLILTSVISGTANAANDGSLGRIFVKSVSFYIIVGTAALLIGFALVNIFVPGAKVQSQILDGNIAHAYDNDFLFKSLIEIIPNNLFAVLSEQKLLSIIIFSLLFGFFISKVNPKSRLFLTNFFVSANDVVLRITRFLVRIAPLGIFALMSSIISDYSGDTERFLRHFNNIATFSWVVLLGFFIHAVIFVPIFVRFAYNINPYKQFRAVESALLTAFVTRSSAWALPLTADTSIRRVGISNRVAGFSLPLGSTLNLCGTILYECVAVVFVAQVYGIDLTINEQLTVFYTAALITVGTAGMPVASLVIISSILGSLNLPLEAIGIIAVLDITFGMVKSAVNVWVDACCASAVARSEGENLAVSS